MILFLNKNKLHLLEEVAALLALGVFEEEAAVGRYGAQCGCEGSADIAVGGVLVATVEETDIALVQRRAAERWGGGGVLRVQLHEACGDGL